MKFSIVIPSLDQGQFIEACIRSVIGQAGDFELECIVVDGASSDDTMDTVQRYERMISSGEYKSSCRKVTMRSVSEPDRGQSHAINKGMAMASGDLVNWLCADDLLEPGALERIRRYFVDHPETQAYCADAIAIDASGRELRRLCGADFTMRDAVRRLDRASHTFYINQPTVFIPRATWDRFGPLDESNHTCMDYELYLNIRSIEKFSYEPAIVARIRLHHGSKSVIARSRQFRESLAVSWRYWEGDRVYHIFWYIIGRIRKAIGRVIDCFLKQDRGGVGSSCV